MSENNNLNKWTKNNLVLPSEEAQRIDKAGQKLFKTPEGQEDFQKVIRRQNQESKDALTKIPEQ